MKFRFELSPSNSLYFILQKNLNYILKISDFKNTLRFWLYTCRRSITAKPEVTVFVKIRSEKNNQHSSPPISQSFFNIRFRLVYWFKSKCLYGAPLLGLAQNNPPLGQTQQQTQHYVASKNTIENRSHIILHVSPINIKLIKVRQKMEDETCLKITLCMNKHLHSNGKLRVQDSALEHETWNNLLWHPNIY